MEFSDVQDGMAIHVSGHFLLDRPDVPRRYIVLRLMDPMNPGGDAEDYRVFRSMDKPKGFPEDNWIRLTD